MSVIAAGMTMTVTDGYESMATPSRREILCWVVLMRVSEVKGPHGHLAIPDLANCYAEVADGSLGDDWVVKPGLEQMKAAWACSVESDAAVFHVDSDLGWVAV